MPDAALRLGIRRLCAQRLAEEGADIIAVDICKDIHTVGDPQARDEAEAKLAGTS